MIDAAKVEVSVRSGHRWKSVGLRERKSLYFGLSTNTKFIPSPKLASNPDKCHTTLDIATETLVRQGRDGFQCEKEEG